MTLPNIRYHNQELEFERTISEDSTPVFAVFDKEGNEVEEFGSANMDEQQILEKIQELDQDLRVQQPEEEEPVE